MSERFTNEELQAIVEGARARNGWELSFTGACIHDNHDLILCDEKGSNMQFILDAIHALPQLHQQVQDLQAANAALQAQVGEWQGAEESRSVDEHQIMGLAQLSQHTGFTVTALRSACYKGLMKHWKINNNQHYASTIAEVERYRAGKGKNRVLGWRPLPDESATAAESEEI